MVLLENKVFLELKSTHFQLLLAPRIYTGKTFLSFLRGFESVQSEQLMLELSKQNIEVKFCI